jgi:hypothetical protein
MATDGLIGMNSYKHNKSLQPTPYSVRSAPASGHDGVHFHGGEAACSWNQVKELRRDF